MTFETHNSNDQIIAEMIPGDFMIRTVEDALDLLGNLFYQYGDKVILHAQSIVPDFFDLKSGLAGEVLQKFSNYRVRLAIVGDFTQFTGKSIQDFIYESNKGRQINFAATIDEAISALSRK